MNRETAPWVVVTGDFYNRVLVALESDDKLTRIDAQCKFLAAQEFFVDACDLVTHLNSCFALEAA